MGSKAAYSDPGPAEAGWKPALRRAAHDVAAKHELWHAALERRDRLVLEAWEAGTPIREVADVALMTHVRVEQIVAARSPGPVLGEVPQAQLEAEAAL
jgi:hypothetical protein